MIEVAPKFIGESGKSKFVYNIKNYTSIEIFDPKCGESPFGAGFRPLPEVGLNSRVAESIRLDLLHGVGSRDFISGVS